MAGRKRARSVGTVEGVRGVGQDEGIGADIDCPGGEARLAEEIAPQGDASRETIFAHDIPAGLSQRWLTRARPLHQAFLILFWRRGRCPKRKRGVGDFLHKVLQILNLLFKILVGRWECRFSVRKCQLEFARIALV